MRPRHRVGITLAKARQITHRRVKCRGYTQDNGSHTRYKRSIVRQRSRSLLFASHLQVHPRLNLPQRTRSPTLLLGRRSAQESAGPTHHVSRYRLVGSGGPCRGHHVTQASGFAYEVCSGIYVLLHKQRTDDTWPLTQRWYATRCTI